MRLARGYYAQAIELNPRALQPLHSMLQVTHSMATSWRGGKDSKGRDSKDEEINLKLFTLAAGSLLTLYVGSPLEGVMGKLIEKLNADMKSETKEDNKK